MTATSQQIPSNPALHFANIVRERTNDALDLIDILHDIAQGKDQRATANDRITAANVLLDRGLGKCPRQPLDSDTDDQTDDTESAESNNHSSDNPSRPFVSFVDDTPDAQNPRPVTQIKDTLNDTLGPAPNAQNTLSLEGEGWGEGEKSASDPNSIHFTIQKHILTITNNGQTLCDTLEEIARAEDDLKVTPYHRARAARILLDRILGTGRAPKPSEAAEKKPYVRPVRVIDPEDLAEIDAKLQRMEDEGILTPDPDAPPFPYAVPEIPEWFDPTPYLEEASRKFEEDIKMRLERQKAWPAIEERRRKKLARMYPSHSEDQDVTDDPGHPNAGPDPP